MLMLPSAILPSNSGGLARDALLVAYSEYNKVIPRRPDFRL